MSNPATTTRPALAAAERHTAADGTRYFLAVCPDHLCGVVLADGHRFDAKDDAQHWCSAHNHAKHITYRLPAGERDEVAQMFWDQRPAWG